jgi:hypothetical protein
MAWVTQENAIKGRAINIILGSLKKRFRFNIVEQNATLGDTNSEKSMDGLTLSSIGLTK